MKKKTTKKTSKTYNYVQNPKILLGVLCALLAVFAAVAISVLVGEFRVVRFQARESSEFIMKQMVANANSSLYVPAVVDARDSMMYFPEARLRMALPKDLAARRAVYQYEQFDGQPAGKDILLINDQAVVNSIQLWPNSMPCARRLARVTFSEASAEEMSQETLIDTHTVADGRTIYLYGTKMELCPTISGGETTNAFAHAFKQLQSY